LPIPEYDWKKGNPQEFYDTFVKRPHPVVLKGFMLDTALLKELNWDSVCNVSCYSIGRAIGRGWSWVVPLMF
jgi:hypothetical protein